MIKLKPQTSKALGATSSELSLGVGRWEERATVFRWISGKFLLYPA